MSRVTSWSLFSLLLIGVLAQGTTLWRGQRGSGFATLPIFVPVSLEYERTLRQRRGQPAGQGGEEALHLVQALQEMDLDPTTRARVAPLVERLKTARSELLAARERRHGLNIALMDVGVALARQLDPAQWDHIHMHRDALREAQEMEAFERLLQRLAR